MIVMRTLVTDLKPGDVVLLREHCIAQDYEALIVEPPRSTREGRIQLVISSYHAPYAWMTSKLATAKLRVVRSAGRSRS